MSLTHRPPVVTHDDDVETALVLAFAPMHKLAFGVAIGTVAGLAVFLVTAIRLVRLPAEPTDLVLLAQFFTGYTESWTGALVGMAWGFAVGSVAGWFAAFVRNFVLATWLLIVRARADLEAGREFLDHI